MRSLVRLGPFCMLPWLMAAACGDDTPSPPPSASGGVAGKLSFPAAGEGGSDVGETQGGAPQLAGAAGATAGAGDAAVAGAPEVDCNSGKGAVITGRVLSPSGELPLAGVTVYVPSETVDALPKGSGCFRCDLAFSGEPIALAVTGADGRFEIDNAPVGSAVPLVVQTGKWRKQLQLAVEDCRESSVSETETRLPRRQSEGNLPAIALVSGGEDTLECLLRKLGVD